MICDDKEEKEKNLCEKFIKYLVPESLKSSLEKREVNDKEGDSYLWYSALTSDKGDISILFKISKDIKVDIENVTLDNIKYEVTKIAMHCFFVHVIEHKPIGYITLNEL